METEGFLTPRKLIQSALARTSSRTSMASSPSVMAVRTPTSLSRNSTSSCNNTTGSRFNLLPVLQTPPSRIFKGRIMNPFEPHLTERFHLPMIGSPSLFQRPNTPQNSNITQFEWTIDEVSSLGPANVEPHETQFIETPDPVAEARVQAAISTYFKEYSIVPSPIDCPLRNQKIVLSKDSINTTSTASGPGQAKRKHRNGMCQTVLSFPPNLPQEVEDMLQKYLTYNEQDQQQKHDGSLDVSSASSIDHDARDASLRRKLFNTSAVIDDRDSDGSGASRYGNSTDDFDLRALSPAPQSPEVVVVQDKMSEQDLKRSRYYGSQDVLNHIVESDADSSFGALSPISKSLASLSPIEAFEQHHSDADAIYRSTPEPSTTFHSDNLSAELNESRQYLSGSIKHTELTDVLAEANLSNEGEKSHVLSSQSFDCSQMTHHSTTPLRGYRRRENRRTNRKNLSQSFLQFSDKDRAEDSIPQTDTECDLLIVRNTASKALSPIKEIAGLSESVLRCVNFYRTDSGFNEESQSNDFAHELSDVSMLSEDFSNTPGRKRQEANADTCPIDCRQ
ncbi:protein aurora borealis isoform X1 [Anopheles stephensi]|uniref:protein aurora borealis isoform X1 n=1 Tax=Anopheles stephensi TaxID=30069 RepID=UPI0016589346|nr:protein aurora borealis isoform X1 [Anopheles stephensi]